MNCKWNAFEENFIRENLDKGDEECACILSGIVGRTISMSAYRKKRQTLSLKKSEGGRPKKKEKHDEKL